MIIYEPEPLVGYDVAAYTAIHIARISKDQVTLLFNEKRIVVDSSCGKGDVDFAFEQLESKGKGVDNE